MQTGTCDSCGEPIVWALVLTKTGKRSRMPLDADPVVDGNLAVYRDHLGALKARTLGKGEAPEPFERRGVTHFATCKYADRHRKGPGGLPQNVIPLRRNQR